MKYYLITLRSMTYALKAQKRLGDNGIASETIKLGSEYAKRGCTSGLRIDFRDKTAAERLLTASGIPYVAVRPL